MASQWLPGLRRVCEAVPKTKLDTKLESLSALQRLLVFVVTAGIVLTVAPLLTGSDGAPVVAVALAFGTMWGLADLLSWYNRQ